MKSATIAVILLSITTACSLPSCSKSHWQQIDCNAKDTPVYGHALYRAKVPDSWTEISQQEPSQTPQTLERCVAVYRVGEPGASLDIRVSSHPIYSIEDRCPPRIKVCDWCRHLKGAVPATRSTSFQRGDYIGLAFYGEGRDRDGSATLGWAMTLGTLAYRELEGVVDEPRVRSYLAADYTICVTGPKDLVRRHRKEIERFARSFKRIPADEVLCQLTN